MKQSQNAVFDLRAVNVRFLQIEVGKSRFSMGRSFSYSVRV